MLVAKTTTVIDRGWQPGRPFRPRISRLRRWSMAVVFVLLLALIGGYWYITDSLRISAMAQSYLAEKIGGPVHIGRATLSIFEGLRLDDIRVQVDNGGSPDSLLFTAETLLIQYDVGALLSGKIEATQIVAIDPHVMLTEDPATGEWNYQRLQRPRTSTSRPSEKPGPLVLPELLLRNAVVEYSEIRNRRSERIGSLAIEGRLSPGRDAHQYAFDFQSRGDAGTDGPRVTGSLSSSDGHVTAQLANVVFGRDVRAMLPAQVRHWCEQHELTGQVDIPQLDYTPAHGRQPAIFQIQTELRDIGLAIRPEEWLSGENRRRLAGLRGTFDDLRSMRLNTTGLVDRLAPLIDPLPLRLEKASASLLFTDAGVKIRDLRGRVGDNGLRITGHIDGYAPEAPTELRVRSLETENLYIPHAPRFVNWLPDDTRELYEHLQPEGTCAIDFTLRRPTAGAEPIIGGEVRVLDGHFVFDDFPYPLRHAAGRIAIETDPLWKVEGVAIHDLRGLGVEGGPNEKSWVTINGFVGPFGVGTGVRIHVAGENITSEPALRRAFPRDVRKALMIFGPTDLARQRLKGPVETQSQYSQWPHFSGSFGADILRPMGRMQHWSVDVDVKLDDANGALTVFPYPLEHASVLLQVRDGYMNIVNASMKRGNSTLRIDGRVDFGDPVDPKLTVVAKNVPVDQDLLEAMPPEQRKWLSKLGPSGTLDIDGRVFLAAPVPGHEPDIDFNFGIALRDGGIHPPGSDVTMTGVHGDMRLFPQRLQIATLDGLRGQSPVHIAGTLAWPEDQPWVDLNATASDLVLDRPLYQVLPDSAREGWDAVQPEGTLDLDLALRGPISQEPATRPAAAAMPVAGPATPATQPTADMHVTLKPRNLAATPQVIPYRMENISGVVEIQNDRVILHDLAARHGAATLKIAGEGNLGKTSLWDVKLSANDVPVDADLRCAVPDSLATMLDGLKVDGKLSFAFPQLRYRSPGAPSATSRPHPQTRSTTRPASDADIDFVASVVLAGDNMDAGVPLNDLHGTVTLAGNVRSGSLAALSGKIDIAAMKLIDRPMRHFRAELSKKPDSDVLQLLKMQAELAGGELAGDVNLGFPDEGPAGYNMSLVLHNVDVRQLGVETSNEVRGRLSASLSMEGAWNDPRSRRGTGDVSLIGDSMYRIPLVMGLLQITNLSLPIAGPFNEASARYSLDGQHVTFGQIELRSENLLMQGQGSMDFGSRKVNLTFVTDNPRGWKIPLIDDIVRPLRNELFQVHVTGTIQEPKVRASSLSTFQTTVDQVLRSGSQNRKDKP